MEYYIGDQLIRKGWFEDDFSVYCDPAGGERIQEITSGIKVKNAVDSGLDYINSLIERERLYISSECSGFYLRYGTTPGVKTTRS